VPHDIQEREDFYEVTLTGASSAWEVLEIIHSLRDRDPHKEHCDLWVLGTDFSVPISSFSDIAGGVKNLVKEGFVGNKTAVVVSNLLQRAAVFLYKKEAEKLPFPIKVFSKREDAVAWLS
jgi:hypothetical protein